LHFHIEDETYQSIIRNKKRIEIVSKERIVDELNKIMRSVKPSIGFALLKKTGLLAEIMPEIDALSGIETKNGKSHKDVFWHTLEVVDKLAEKSDNLWLRWAALFHDVGKPASKRFDNKIGWTFHNHNYIGERMIPRIFKQMKMPMNENMRFVQKIVTLHMRPIALVEDEITDSAVRRLLFEAGDDIDDLMLLCEADITSKNEVKAQKYLQNLQIVRQKLKDIEQKDHVRNFQPPIDGKEIMELFHLPPCAEVGTIKMAIKDAILDGVIPNEYDAAYAFMMEKAKEMGLK
jgi:poly(A) polymerase